MMMMQQHMRAPGNLQRAARGRAAPASPLAPALRSVLVRFKEDDKTEAEFKKVRAGAAGRQTCSERK